MAYDQNPQSWYDLSILPPVDPRIIVVNALMGTTLLGATQGAFTRSTNFVGGATWIASPFKYAGSITCTALHTDDLLAVADAAQWTFQHQSDNIVATMAPPLQKLTFVRGGSQWQMVIPINLGGATYSDLQLSFRNNATSPGDFAGGSTGSIPVVQFNAALTGTVNLYITLSQLGRYVMAISARDGGGNWSMFEMEWIVVA